MLQSRKWSIFQICLTIISLISFLSFLVISFSIYLKKSHNDDDDITSSEIYNYQIIEYNTETKETSAGFAKLPIKLEPNEVIRYPSTTSSSISMISNVGMNEYICQGCCYCEEERDVHCGNDLHLTNPSMDEHFEVLVAVKTDRDAVKECDKEIYTVCMDRLKPECDEKDKFVVTEIKDPPLFVQEISSISDNESEDDDDFGITIRKKKEEDENNNNNNIKVEHSIAYCEGYCSTRNFKSDSKKKKARKFKCQEYFIGAKREIVNNFEDIEWIEEQEDDEQEGKKYEDLKNKYGVSYEDDITLRTSSEYISEKEKSRNLILKITEDFFYEEEVRSYCEGLFFKKYLFGMVKGGKYCKGEREDVVCRPLQSGESIFEMGSLLSD